MKVIKMKYDVILNGLLRISIISNVESVKRVQSRVAVLMKN
ncbi:hypothetical protein Q2T41_01240 [Maribacter confluentis]|uniref:Uncharacterized protein n=1 Tax=Maribacter confluentis TaxID=1656093 RepID=A0ABT8RLE1_9FLAO|nr:hypothetical protein [Maribacter confluentis]MDO1511287.1 hypothetical protein [Maribacter confluentis]